MKHTILPIVTLFVFTALAQAADPLPELSDVIYGSSVNAAKFKRLEQLKELIDQGADVNAAIGFDRMLSEGETQRTSRKPTAWPLDVAVQQARVDMVKLLLANGAKFHGKELAKAAFAGNQDESLAMITALLKAGADVNSPDDGFTALHWASYKGNKELGQTPAGTARHQTRRNRSLTVIPRSWRRRNMAMRRSSKCCSRRVRTSVSPTGKARRRLPSHRRHWRSNRHVEKQQAMISKLQSPPK